MPAIVMYQGSVLALNAFAAAAMGPGRVGLFQNDWEPKPWHTITAVVPCNFSGYVGLQALSGATPAVVEGIQAVTRFTPRTWSHNGGAVQGYIFGYYVVDGAGRLLWAERDPDGPTPMIRLGAAYPVTPTLTQQSELGNESP